MDQRFAPEDFSDRGKFDSEGESQLQLQLRKETYEIEEAHRRKADRAGRIAELQGSHEPVPVIRRVEPLLTLEGLRLAGLARRPAWWRT